nr:hypothetical protein [Tanacetum cinerariifolium]
MVAPVPENIIARHVSGDLIDFNGETLVLHYMRFFFNQKIVETCRFVTRMREEANTVMGCIAQMTALVAELQAMENQDEVYNGLLAAKNAKHEEESHGVVIFCSGVYGFSLCSLLSFQCLFEAYLQLGRCMTLLGLTLRMSMMGSSFFKHRECGGMPRKFKQFKNSTGERLCWSSVLSRPCKFRQHYCR